MKVIYNHTKKEKVTIITTIVIGTLLSFYIAFVSMDCFRLAHAKEGTKPFITIYTQEYETKYRKETKYIGLGYSVKYYEARGLGCGTEFRLFDKIRIWSEHAM